MTITASFSEIMDTGYWEDFCSKYGINPYCISEGLCSDDDTYTISVEDAKEYGLI